MEKAYRILVLRILIEILKVVSYGSNCGSRTTCEKLKVSADDLTDEING